MITGNIGLVYRRRLLFYDVADYSRVEIRFSGDTCAAWQLQSASDEQFLFKQNCADGAAWVGETEKSGGRHGERRSTFASDGVAEGVFQIYWNHQRVTRVMLDSRELVSAYRDGWEVFACEGLTVNLSNQTGKEGGFRLEATSILAPPLAVLLASFCWWVEETRYVAM